MQMAGPVECKLVGKWSAISQLIEEVMFSCRTCESIAMECKPTRLSVSSLAANVGPNASLVAVNLNWKLHRLRVRLFSNASRYSYAMPLLVESGVGERLECLASGFDLASTLSAMNVRGLTKSRVDMRSLDPLLKLGSIILSTFFMPKLHSSGAKTYRPKLFALTG